MLLDTSGFAGAELLAMLEVRLEENTMTGEQLLEQRVAALEQEVARLKADSVHKPMSETRGARLIRQAEESQADLVAGWQRFMQTFDIQGPTLGVKELRETLQAQGLNPDHNLFSREIIAMREERAE